ncbi:MAG: antitoxin VapB family protein [Candidatus Hodarchaeales archaeon]
MGSKTISLDDEAYKRLKREKKANESFSDVVKRITKPVTRKPLIEFAGIWNLSPKEWDTMQKSLASLSRAFDDLFGQ